MNDEFWEAMGLQLMAYKRVLNRLLHTEVPEDILQGAHSGSSYFQDGHFNWVREQFSNYTDDSFVTLQDEDVTRWWTGLPEQNPHKSGDQSIPHRPDLLPDALPECLGEVADERTGQKRTKLTAAAAARAIVHFLTASWIKQGGTTLSSRWREFWGRSHT